MFFRHLNHYHKQILVALAFALTGFAVSAYQYAHKIGNLNICIFATLWYVVTILFWASMQSNHPCVALPEDPAY